MRLFLTRPVALAVGACLLFSGAAGADEGKKSPADIVAELKQRQPPDKMIELADALLAHKDATNAQKEEARKAKSSGLFAKGRSTGDYKALDGFIADLKENSPKSAAIGMGSAYSFAGKYVVGRGNPAAPKVIAEAKELAKSYPTDPLVSQVIGMYAGSLEKADAAKAKTFINEASKLMPTNAALKSMLLTMVGSKIAIDGPTLEGSEFTLASMKGKVVLVDFWATWCGPCVGEMPNVKKAYDALHSKGFEIVGVSLDNKRDALEKFVKEKELPWTQIIFSAKKEMGWDNPIAVKYGIRSIPATILIGRDGKIAAKNLRGPALEKAVKAELAKGSQMAN